MCVGERPVSYKARPPPRDHYSLPIERALKPDILTISAVYQQYYSNINYNNGRQEVLLIDRTRVLSANKLFVANFLLTQCILFR